MSNYMNHLIRKLKFYAFMFLGIILLIGGLLLSVAFESGWYLLIALAGFVILGRMTYLVKKNQYENRTRRRYR